MPYPDVIDLDRLLRYFRDLFAHSLTLEQMLLLPESDRTEEKYKSLRSQNDVAAEQEFRLFFRALHESTDFADAMTAFENMHPKNPKIH
jgi:hypothetical protein